MDGKFKRNLLISSGVSFLILVISSTASFISITNLLDSNWWVNHTYEVIYNLNSGEAELTGAQTSMRGFLITGKQDFLKQYNNAGERADSYFDKVEGLTGDNSRQQKFIKELRPLKSKFFEYLDLRVKEKMSGQPVSTDDLDEGKALIDKISVIMKRMVDEEKRLLVIRTSKSGKYSTYSLILIVAAAIISLFITVVFFTRLLRDNAKRIQLHKELIKNEQDTAERIRVISNIAAEISHGNYDIRIDDAQSDALGSVAGSLNAMAHALGNSFQLLSQKEWLQTGIAELNKTMIGEKSVNQLARDIIEYLASYTNSSAAALYLLDGDELYAAAGYSYIPDKSRERFPMGSGLTGQAAVSERILELKSLSPDDIKISYALGEAKPRHVMAVPLIDGKLAGVAEMASIKEYSPRDTEFFTAAAHNIAVAIAAAQNRQKVQDLLEETQAQSEELRAQHTELEGMNAELEAQSQKLQASEEELRVQQEELQQTNAELSERGILLEQKNSEIQKKSADLELSTKYKSEFLANMSHELRTPLNSILLLSRLLSENNDSNMNGEQVEFAKVIQSSGNGLLALIDEILDLSKIEAGKMDLEVTEVPIREVSDGLKNLFGEVAKAKNIEFAIVDKKTPEVIKTDRLRLEQILKNLISNAIKFTSKGSVSLEIMPNPADNKSVSFIVKDTGIGIPHEKQPLIFEAFQQADGSTKRKYGGTGLGLSISRELAKLLQGEILLTSQVGQGSEFTLNIPLIASVTSHQSSGDTDDSIGQSEAAVITQENIPASGGNYLSSFLPDDLPDDRDEIAGDDKAILIVEDDVNFAKSLLEFTRQKGYKGIVCVRGDQALGLALRYSPVGVLLDIQLPVKSGWEVMEELKGNPKTRHIPVHIMSSHKVKQESLLKGAVRFLDKPVAFEELPDIFRRIEHIINRESHKVLIIEDNPKHAQALSIFLETYNINSAIKSEVSEGVNALLQKEVDCVILDMGIPNLHAYELLEDIKKNDGLENLPIIVFTGKSLSLQEEVKIKKYADSIIVKTAHSYQRMLDEVSLFLHLMEEHTKGNAKGQKKLNITNDALNGKTVLVVDDDVRNIYSLTKALEVLKMNVISAIDGTEALKVLKEQPETDIVLLDMMMPNMDGYETARRIRQDDKLKHLPVIAVTAKAMTGDREKCISAGASDYITKPVDVDQLMSLLRVWLYDKA